MTFLNVKFSKPDFASHSGPGGRQKRPKLKILEDLLEIWYIEVFGVADFESDIKTKTSKMADLIWRPQ